MRFTVKVSEPVSGELRVITVEADTVLEALRIGELKVAEAEKERIVVETKYRRAEAFLEAQQAKIAKESSKREAALQAQQAKIAKESSKREAALQAEQSRADEELIRVAKERQSEEARRIELVRQEAQERRDEQVAQKRRDAQIAASRVGPTRWRYKMIQIPPNIEVAEGQGNDQVAAEYLERVVDHYAILGWEFFRVDEIGVMTNPGCLSILLGATPTHTAYFVVTFRCEVARTDRT